MGWGCVSVVEHLPSMHKFLDLISGGKKRKEKRRINILYSNIHVFANRSCLYVLQQENQVLSSLSGMTALQLHFFGPFLSVFLSLPCLLFCIVFILSSFSSHFYKVMHSSTHWVHLIILYLLSLLMQEIANFPIFLLLFQIVNPKTIMWISQ